MTINRVRLVYFSPTGTTRRILESIAGGIAAEEVVHLDLTLPAAAEETAPLSAGELVIIGAPVYGGRLPVDAVERFRRIKAGGRILAVAVVVYGNRAFEDALLELKDLAVAMGLSPIAGGAFIGEHSFATRDLPIANGRPDGLDVRVAMEFGEKIRAKVAALPPAGKPAELQLPGRFPYAGGAKRLAVTPVTREDVCTACGTCAGVCPTAAITVHAVHGRVATRVELCIRCSACIKNCPEGARSWQDDTVLGFARWLKENCGARKEPEVFGI